MSSAVTLFFICQELYWMRVLCISFTSSCFLFPVGGGSKNFDDWGEGELKKFRTGGGYQFGGVFLVFFSVGQYPITCHEEAKNIARILSPYFARNKLQNETKELATNMTTT